MITDYSGEYRVFYCIPEDAIYVMPKMLYRPDKINPIDWVYIGVL